jgi:hypothetical protein
VFAPREFHPKEFHPRELVPREACAPVAPDLPRGAAQDPAETGATDLEIMHAGRWRSLAQVARYTAKVRAKFGSMAKLAAKQEAGATPA